MIGYVMLGTNDPAKARAFYEPLLAQIGFHVSKTYTDDRRIWFRGASGPMLVLTLPYDDKTATNGNGTMVALDAPSPEVIRKVHADALAAGATDEGALRDHGGGFFGAYFRDHDGNKICVFKMG